MKADIVEIYAPTQAGISVKIHKVEAPPPTLTKEERSRWQKWVDRWSADLEAVVDAPLLIRAAAVTAILWEMDSFLQMGGGMVAVSGSMAAVPALAPASAMVDGNSANPDKGGLFTGDGKILLNMVLYAGAGFILSMILRYMGRGEFATIVLAITGFVVLRQFVFILKELLYDVKNLINL